MDARVQEGLAQAERAGIMIFRYDTISEALFDIRDLLQGNDLFDEDDLETLTAMAMKYEDLGSTIRDDPELTYAEL